MANYRSAARRRVCPFAHPGERGRRRSLDKVAYGPELCGYIRRGRECPAGDECTMVGARQPAAGEGFVAPRRAGLERSPGPATTHVLCT
jgi:hypothetical protein